MGTTSKKCLSGKEIKDATKEFAKETETIEYRIGSSALSVNISRYIPLKDFASAVGTIVESCFTVDENGADEYIPWAFEAAADGVIVGLYTNIRSTTLENIRRLIMSTSLASDIEKVTSGDSLRLRNAAREGVNERLAKITGSGAEITGSIEAFLSGAGEKIGKFFDTVNIEDVMSLASKISGKSPEDEALKIIRSSNKCDVEIK